MSKAIKVIFEPAYSFKVNDDNSITISRKLRPGSQEHRDTICEIFGYPTGMDKDTFENEVKIYSMRCNK